nr:DUF2805 domain-containing protein [Spirosoma luteum]
MKIASEYRTPFETIKVQSDLSEADIINVMRSELKRSSFNLWRKRVNSGIRDRVRSRARLSGRTQSQRKPRRSLIIVPYLERDRFGRLDVALVSGVFTRQTSIQKGVPFWILVCVKQG